MGTDGLGVRYEGFALTFERYYFVVVYSGSGKPPLMQICSALDDQIVLFAR